MPNGGERVGAGTTCPPTDNIGFVFHHHEDDAEDTEAYYPIKRARRLKYGFFFIFM